jgi:L-fuculose-phosphate aldolase
MDSKNEEQLRHDIVARCRELEASGLNRGSSGNVSARAGKSMLITPSAVPAGDLNPGLIARMLLDGGGVWEGPMKPSSEWRFHLDLMRARPDVGAIVHTHAPYSTILAIARRPIPAIHYMIAAFGGPDIRCAGYATYGTAELSAHVVAAMEGRNGCLMANHGMLVAGPNLTRTTWLAHELEALAHQYYHALLIGGGHVLSDAQVAETAVSFAGYGVNERKV